MVGSLRVHRAMAGRALQNYADGRYGDVGERGSKKQRGQEGRVKLERNER